MVECFTLLHSFTTTLSDTIQLLMFKVKIKKRTIAIVLGLDDNSDQPVSNADMVHHGTEGEFVVALDVGADVGSVLARPLVLKNEESIKYFWTPLSYATSIFPEGVHGFLQELIW